MHPRLKIMAASIMMLMAAACATTPRSAEENAPQRPTFYEWLAANPVASPAPPTATVFSQHLSRFYLAFSRFEKGAMLDQRSAPVFERKTQAAAQGQNPPPERLEDWPVPAQFRNELAQARQRMVNALDAGARTRSAENAAAAQGNLDCWVEQQTENFQPVHIMECKNGFLQAIAKVEADLGPVAQAPAACQATTYVMLFAWNKSDINPLAVRVADQAAADFVRLGCAKVRVEGHTDRSGPDSYNQKLSERRTKAAIDALAARGVPVGAITSASFGESRPKVPTADGVRNDENRRAEITMSR